MNTTQKVMPEIEKLIALWNARPPRVEPDNEDHLLYIFTGLLPALRRAMPEIVELMKQTPPATVRPSTDLPPAPGPAPSSHSPVQTPNTAGNAEGFGQTADNAGRSAASPASGGATVTGASTKPPEVSKRARPMKARKPAAVPHEQLPKTDETAPV